MLFTVDQGDHEIGRHAPDILDKKLDKLRDDTEALAMNTMQIQMLQGHAIEARKALNEHDTMLELVVGANAALRLALRLYREKLLDTALAQTKLFVEPKDTEGRVAVVTALLEKLSEQKSLFAAAR